MNIVIISPAYPLRGGIAAHANTLYKRLIERGHTVHLITFKRQYPGLLFPGKTQMTAGSSVLARVPSEPILDSVGPLSWWRVAKRLQVLQPDVIIFQYWMPFFAPAYGIISWLAGRWTRALVLYLCHNIIPHERRPGDISLTRFAFCHADAFIVQSKVVEQQLQKLYPNANYRLIPHPVYDIFGEPPECAEARRQLDLADQRVLLFFGYVRAYKGLDLLLRAMPGILQQIKIKLLVVGEFYEDEERYRNLISELGIGVHVRVHPEFVPDEEIGVYFSAANAVVLPYKSATQSGIVQLAHHFDKPCIVTDVGGLSEVVVNGKTGYVVRPDDSAALAEAVVKFYRNNCEQDFSRNVKKEKKKYSWDRMLDAIENFMLADESKNNG